MTHAYQTLRKCIKAIQQIKRERPDAPIHAVIWGEWGCGKTKAIHQIAKEFKIPYIKAEKNMTVNMLIRKITRAWGTEAGQRKDQNLDILLGLVARFPVEKRLMLVDEAQRIYKKQYLDDLKDLGEDEDILISFIFVGDTSLKQYLTEGYHSLNKRVLVVPLERLAPETVESFLMRYGLKGNVEALFKTAWEMGLTTLEIDNAFFFLAKAKQTEVSPEMLKDTIAQLKKV